MEVTGKKTVTLLTVDEYTILNVTSRVVAVRGGNTLTVCADFQMCMRLESHCDTMSTTAWTLYCSEGSVTR